LNLAAAEKMEKSMTTLTLSVTHVKSTREEPCAVCGAEFVPREDTGSRVLSITVAPQTPFVALLCGGCYSKWSHGTTVTVRANAAADRQTPVNMGSTSVG
jgi:hypothetical protein